MTSYEGASYLEDYGAWLTATLANPPHPPCESRVETSPCGGYQMSISRYLIVEEDESHHSLGLGELKRSSGEPLERIESCMGFSCTWVPAHPSGLTYVICHEDPRGVTVIELGSARRIDYTPPEMKGAGFLAMERHVTEDGRKLFVTGCIAGREFELIVLDFSQPMSPPYPELWRGRCDTVQGFREDGGFVFKQWEYIEDCDVVGDQEYTYLLTPGLERQLLEVGQFQSHEEEPEEVPAAFALALRTLALPPWEQMEVYPPFADITFELVDDYEIATTTDTFLEYEERLDGCSRMALGALKAAIEEIPDIDWEWDSDNIESVLFMPSWTKVRTSAKVVLAYLGVELGRVPKCVEGPPGNWKRETQ